MPKSSKEAGKTKSKDKEVTINEQLLEIRSSIEYNLSKHFGLNRIKYLLRELIEIERLVTRPLPFAYYPIKKDIIESVIDSSHSFDEEEGMESYRQKVRDFFDAHPRTKQDSVNSYIGKHAFYMPKEFQLLMRLKKSIDIESMRFEDVEDAVLGLYGIESFLDDLIGQECKQQHISPQMLSSEKDQYSPKLVWQSDVNSFASLSSSLVNNGWIEDSWKSLDEEARNLAYHFSITVKGKDANSRYISTQLSQFQNKFMLISTDVDKRVDERIYPFHPTKLPKK